MSLPARIRDDDDLCPVVATDFPTVTVTIFSAGASKTVADYHGCMAQSIESARSRVAALRQFERQIDSVAKSTR